MGLRRNKMKTIIIMGFIAYYVIGLIIMATVNSRMNGRLGKWVDEANKTSMMASLTAFIICYLLWPIGLYMVFRKLKEK